MEMKKNINEGDLLELGNDMVKAAEQWMNLNQHGLRGFVRTEVDRILASIRQIGNMVLAGELDTERARSLLQMQKESFQVMMLSVEGIRKVEVENLVNAVMDVVAGTVKRWWGFSW
jgi:hypothetical protein